MNVIVKNTTKAVHSLSVRMSSDKNNIATTMIVLKPGNNEVTQDVWEKSCEHSAVKDRLKKGEYVYVKSDLGDDEQIEQLEKGAAESLAGFNVKEAADLIYETYDYDLLVKWEGEDSRAGVQKAITAQVKKNFPERS